MYSVDNCKYIGQWDSPCPQASLHTPSLCGLAVDANDNVYVGHYQPRSSCVHKLKQGGSFISCIKVSIRPHYLAVTSQNTIIVGTDDHEPPQIISNTGQKLRTLNHPDESLWEIRSVYCYRDTIFITNLDLMSERDEILCYSESGEYRSKLQIRAINPMCLAMIGYSELVLYESRRCVIWNAVTPPNQSRSESKLKIASRRASSRFGATHLKLARRKLFLSDDDSTYSSEDDSTQLEI